MTLVVQNNGEGDAAEYFVNKSSPQNLVLRAFTNNITPAETDNAAAYTEDTASGYASITLTGASWSVTEGAPTAASYAQQTWTYTAASTVYGYYMTRSGSGRIALAERFTGAPFSIPGGGGTIKVTPQITFD